MLQINQVLDGFFNKGFKGTKCKTLLKLASSRIRLLKNKRGMQLKQLRKELAQLLENGQESTACIRVEHIIREQNIMDAYEILEHYCELLIVRMPMMEMQRVCPIDLKEAVSSLIFAAPRASDLPELLEVQTSFSFKYGREFVASATELRPDCGVNRMVIEKLSARAPSARAKLDLMLEIAEEFNVEWDPSSTELEFSTTPQDLLDGPNQFIGPIQMSPIPFPEDDSQSTSTSLRKGEEVILSSPTPPAYAPPATVDPIEEPKFVPFAVPPPHYTTEAVPNRFYSPPRESSITQQSGLLEETLSQRSHSRAKSEGSMNFQDYIEAAEAAEAAAESAEKAAQAAREAAELCRSQVSTNSKSTPQQEANLHGTSSHAPSSTNFKGSLNPDDYDWTHGYKEEQKGDGRSCADTDAHHTPEDYDWRYIKKRQEADALSSQVHVLGKGQLEENRFNFDGEVDASSYEKPAWDVRKEGEDIFTPFKKPPSEHVNAWQPLYDVPKFDGSTVPEPFQRQASLGDDPYYTYPNLFSKSSSG